jgi:hypothetical protein
VLHAYSTGEIKTRPIPRQIWHLCSRIVSHGRQSAVCPSGIRHLLAMPSPETFTSEAFVPLESILNIPTTGYSVNEALFDNNASC